MAVDTRLKLYWQNAFHWHRTRDPIWFSFLDIQAMTDDGPSGQAAAKLVGRKSVGTG